MQAEQDWESRLAIHHVGAERSKLILPVILETERSTHFSAR